MMDTIDISQNIQDFKQVFEQESRIIFSARFGVGKSYFLNEFMKSYDEKKNDYYFITLHPVTTWFTYALTEYPCMLRCLEDGSLDLSNNVCERQIRRIAKYRNNSYFVGSPESGVRFARLMSHFANIRKHNLDPVEYLCDVFRRIKKTAKDKLVDLLAHRWQLATVTSWA